MAREEPDDRRLLRSAILDLEEPIMELRDGIAALLAMNPHIAIGEAGMLWIAGKLQEAQEVLLEGWRGLLAETQPSVPGDESEAD